MLRYLQGGKAAMFKQVITVTAFLCLLVPMLPSVLYEGGIQSAPINYKPFASKTPPCGKNGAANCVTHSPPANEHQRNCNPSDRCRVGKRHAGSENLSKAQVSGATKTVQDHPLLQLALLLVLAWYFDCYFLWKKLIGLDELLSEHYEEQNELNENEANKQTKAQKSYDSDEDKNCKEAKLSSLLDDSPKQMKAIGSEEEISDWGLCVFGQQKTMPPLSFSEIGSWSVLQSFMNNELKSPVGLATEQALYSSKEELRSSACEFWCAILSSNIQVGVPPIEFDWYPSSSELKSALEICGFPFNFSSDISVKNSVGPSTTSKRSGGKEKNENKRRRLRRQSAMFKSQEREPAAEHLFAAYQQLDTPLHEDGPTALGSSITTEESCNPRAETRTLTRSSIGRPSCKAVEKVQSYKVPVNVKLRRSD